MLSLRNPGRRSASALVCAAGVAGALWTVPALAQTTPGDPEISGASPPGGLPMANAEPAEPGDTYLGSVWRRSNMLGDMGGLRTVLGGYGVSLGLQETSEVLGNVTGGVKKGWVYDGSTLLSIGVDAEKAFGVAGGTFNISGVQLHGGNLSATKLLNLQTVSGITGDPATRLWELWYQQAFLDGNVDVKIGQQSIDQEFIVSGGSSLFLNTMTGWPMLPTADLYAGGPVYPLSSLGLRLRARPTESLTLLAGVFNDNPPGGPFNNDSQLRGAERYGALFNLNTGALFIAEAQYAINQPVKSDTDAVSHPLGLAGIYRLGGWFDTATFNNQRYDNTGLSLANPASTGVPAQISQNFSLYGVMDQAIWRPDPEGVQSLNIFARVMGAPGSRNLIAFSLNAGVTLKAPLPGRDDDSFGIGYGLAQVSGAVAGLDQDIAYYSGAPYPKRSSESFLEITYQIQFTPWWQIQPDFQYIFMPGGGIPNPNFPNQRISNEAVFGVRTNITF